ncbi:hypothetical protein BOX15_Mlig028828g2 [Macrostomum lignano]|uniref:Uncharacterized protein n=1 Tax=Macrostomum lignano TaxID=282301 RepID=A0A267DQ33_9PLAT|nr:hypothetical protein BOX15_Mlig028828g2 [Macrostomum lignano]
MFLSALGSDGLHFQPTKEAIDFWKVDKTKSGGCQCSSCSDGYCSMGLVQVARKVILAHLELTSSSVTTSHGELMDSKFSKAFLSSISEGSKEECDVSAIETAYKRLESLTTSIGQEDSVLMHECLAILSGLLCVNEALVSLRQSTDEWPKKCAIARSVVTWHLSPSRQHLIDNWIKMLLRKAAGVMFFNVAKLKEVCNYQNFRLAFKWFEAMIERKEEVKRPVTTRKLLMRKTDKDIVASEFTITGIISMAACLLELRQTVRANILLDLFRKKLFPRAARTSDERYLKAYADYIRGVCLFEDTNPQRIAIRRPEAYKQFLQDRYTEAKLSLDESAHELEECAPKSSLLASVYTVRGIVRANMLADFSSDALCDLSKATDLECEIRQPTASMRSLLQILRIGADSVSSKQDQNEWNEVYQQALKCHLEVSIKVDCQKYAGARERETKEGNTSCEDKPVPKTISDVVISQIETPLDLVREYLDCYRKEGLEYFKDRLRRCKETNSYVAGLLCHLFIAKYYIYACAKGKVECRQAKVSRLVSMYFGIELSLESYQSITLKRLVSDHHEMGPAIALICGFWIANEAELCLLKVVARNLKLFSPTLHTKDNKSSKLVTTVAFLKIFFSSNHFRLLDQTWRQCRALNEHATLICSELSEDPSMGQSEFVSFLRIYVGELAYRMCDKIKDNQDFSASVRRRSCDELFRVLQQNLSSPEGHVLPSSLAVMCLTALGNFSDAPRNCKTLFGMPDFRLHRFQLAYDLCAAAGLVDTEVHASLHISVGMFLYSNACATVSKPAFNEFNAAIFKFRQAAQIFDTICGDHVGAAMAQGMIAVLYFNQRQLEDQEHRALEAFSECLRLEVSLLQNDCMSSPWLWKTIEVVRKCRYLFLGSHSKHFPKWDVITKHLEMIRDRNLQTLLTEDDWKESLVRRRQYFGKFLVSFKLDRSSS